MNRVLLGEVGALMAVIAGVLYIRSIVFGQTRPHRVTWGVWMLISVLGAGSAIQGGAGAGALVVSVYALTTAVVFGLSLSPRFGKPGATSWYDKWLGVFAVAAIVVWQVGHLGAAFAATMAVAADLFATVPTVREAWKQPEYESLFPWLLTAVAAILGVLAVKELTYSATAYAFYVAVGNAAIAIALIAGSLRRSEEADLHVG